MTVDPEKIDRFAREDYDRELQRTYLPAWEALDDVGRERLRERTRRRVLRYAAALDRDPLLEAAREEARAAREDLEQERAAMARLVRAQVNLVEWQTTRIRLLTNVAWALRDLVRLKDGPRADASRADKDGAWQRGREALAALREGGERC